MKRSVNDYINQARNKAGQHLNFVGDMQFVNQPNFNATGNAAPAPAGASNSAKKSQPYAVVVTSTSGANVQNFDVLGAYQYITDAGMTAGGDLVIGSITISSAIPGVTYRELLYQSMNNPFTVGLTYLSCAATPAQVNEVFTIQTKDANGTSVNIPIVPSVDPYQFQSGINVVEQEYRIDGYTKLIFSNILANAILTIRFFPSDNINPARALAGGAVGKAYGNPGIIRS